MKSRLMLLAGIISLADTAAAQTTTEAQDITVLKARIRQLEEENARKDSIISSLQKETSRTAAAQPRTKKNTPSTPAANTETTIPTETETTPKEDIFTRKMKEYHLSLRQSAFDKAALKKPSQIQYTSAEDGEDSYAIDAGLTWNLTGFFGAEEPRYGEYSLLTEYHRNSLGKSKKNTLFFGLLGQYDIGNIATDPFVHQFDVKALYKRDSVAHTRNFIADVMYWPFIRRAPGAGAESINFGSYWGPDDFLILSQPGLGLQYETGGDPGGSAIRGKFAFDLAFYPFAKTLGVSQGTDRIAGPLEITASYQAWAGLDRSGSFRNQDSYQELFTASINYYFGTYSDKLEQRPFAIGLDYVNGESPEEGFEDDQYWRVGFKAMF